MAKLRNGSKRGSKEKKPDPATASSSPAAAGSTASMQTTIAHSVSARPHCSPAGSGEDPATTVARLEERLKELRSNPSTVPVEAQLDEGEELVNGLVLVLSVKPREGAEKKKSDFKQGLKVKCSWCRKAEYCWRDMKNDKIWADEETMYWLRTCVECYMQQLGISHGEAVAKIKNMRGDNVNRKARIQAFTKARKEVLQNFTLMTDKREIRTLTRMTFVEDLFAPLAKLIELKVRHMDTNKELWEEYEKLLELVEACKTADESKTLMQTIADHEKKMEETELPQAFQAVCQPGSEEHLRYMQAAQYSDEWVCNKKNGKVLSAFRSFYICLAGGAQPCYTVMPSKTWRTFHEDPLASKQRWYCVCCGAKYLTKFGMLIEIEIRGVFYYVKAEIPPDNLEDLRAMWLEQTLKPSRPEDLYEMLKLVTPHASGILKPIEPSDVFVGYQTKYDPNAYKITSSAYNSLPNFDWQQIMNFGEA